MAHSTRTKQECAVGCSVTCATSLSPPQNFSCSSGRAGWRGSQWDFPTHICSSALLRRAPRLDQREGNRRHTGAPPRSGCMRPAPHLYRPSEDPMQLNLWGLGTFQVFSFLPLLSVAANIATFVLQSAQLQVPLVHFSFRKCKMPLVRMEAAAWWYLGIFVRLTLVCGRVPLVHFSFRKCKMPLFRLEACGWWYLRHFVRLFSP